MVCEQRDSVIERSTRAQTQLRHRSRHLTSLTAIALAAFAGGCGSGDTGADTKAPTLSLSALSQTLEGGETTALTVTATDDRDGTVASTINCTGGTLTGNLLITPIVAADTSITCTATAKDRAGNAATASIVLMVKATAASLVLTGDASSLTQGQIGGLTADNLALDTESYTGTIDTTPITLQRTSPTSLGFVVPPSLAAGSHVLSLRIGSRAYSYVFTVTPAPAIADAKAVVLQTVANARTALTMLVATDGALMSAGQRAKIDQALQSLTDAAAFTQQQNAADLTPLAIFFQANGMANSQGEVGTRAVSVTPECELAFKLFAAKSAVPAILSASAYLAGSSVTADYLAASIGAPLPVIAGVVAGGALYTASSYYLFRNITTGLSGVAKACIGLPTLDLSAISTSATGTVGVRAVKALAVAPRYSFTSGAAQSFSVTKRTDLQEGVQTRARSLYASITQELARLPYLPPSIFDALDVLINPARSKVAAADVTLGGISRPDITGLKSGSGDLLVLRFDSTASTTNNVDFTFTLSTSDASVTAAGQIANAGPGAEDAAITVTQGQKTTSTIQIRNADTVQVVEQPTHGDASLTAEGVLVYVPRGQYFGPDRLSYVARNAQGISRTATVLIDVKRVFEGIWRITTRSTTTAESSPGLCPTEINNVTLSFTKLSDVHYVTTYRGRSLDLIMAAVDDPAGLHGELSGTYDDDPGQTTETLRVQVPDSSHLSGSTSFRYVGPNNTSCSGTSTVDGTRP